MKFCFIEAHRPLWRLQTMCRLLHVSKSGYFAWRDGRESPRATKNRELIEKITIIHATHRQTYGSPRTHRHLRKQGDLVSVNRVARLMRQAGIRVTPTRRFTVTTDSDHDHPIAANILEQNFHATEPNTKWVTDITYIPTGEGWLYLAAIVDLFSRRVVGWAMQATMDRSLVLNCLDMAITTRKPGPNFIHHSDRGCQYTCAEYRQNLAKYQAVVSMSRRANCYDNAVIESFWHSLKVECVHRTTFATRAQAKAAIFDYIEVFYNRVRLHSSIGYKTPIEFEAAHLTGAA